MGPALFLVSDHLIDAEVITYVCIVTKPFHGQFNVMNIRLDKVISI